MPLAPARPQPPTSMRAVYTSPANTHAPRTCPPAATHLHAFRVHHVLLIHMPLAPARPQPPTSMRAVCTRSPGIHLPPVPAPCTYCETHTAPLGNPPPCTHLHARRVHHVLLIHMPLAPARPCTHLHARRVHAPPRPVPRLKHQHAVTKLPQLLRRGQACGWKVRD